MKTKRHANFKIGAVSRLTDISVDTLRVWERRYGIVKPLRTSNSSGRLYTQEDISHLSLLKMLVDRGHSIGSIAKLSMLELEQRLDMHNKKVEGEQVLDKTRVIKVALIGEVLGLQIKYHNQSKPLFDLIGVYKDEDDFFTNCKSEFDALILEYPALYEDNLLEIARLSKRTNVKIVLAYGFASSTVQRTLSDSTYICMQAPVVLDQLHSRLKQIKTVSRSLEQVVYKKNQKPQKRLFNNKELIHYASLSSAIKCECPQHLSSITIKLVQFEHYSAECQSRNLKDKKLHEMLGNMAGHARAIMENALAQVIEAEGLEKSFDENGPKRDLFLYKSLIK